MGSSSFLQVKSTTIKSRTSLKFGPIRPWTAELAALERLKIFSQTYNGENLVSTLVPSFLIGSSSFLQGTRTTIKAWMMLNFGGISPLTAEFAALEHLKKDLLACYHSSALIFDCIFFILAGNKKNYIVSDKSEIQPDPSME